MAALAFAHVNYVLSDEEIISREGRDFSFLLQPLGDPSDIAIILTAITAILVLYFSLKRSGNFNREALRIKKEAQTYYDLIPWMLRLGLGIALIGAGTSGALISPALAGFPNFSSPQILLGFLILSGFLLAPALWLAGFLFLTVILKDFYFIGGAEFLAAIISLLILNNSRPGIDHLLGLPFWPFFSGLEKFVPFVLRAGIGGAMMFLAVYEKFLNPRLSAAVAENFHLASVIPVSPEMWVLSAGLIEFTVGLFLLIGFQTRLTAAVAFLVLTVSFFYFQEQVYSHITLFGVLSALFITGGGVLSVDAGLLKKSTASVSR